MLTSNSFLNTGYFNGAGFTLNTPAFNTFNFDGGAGLYVDNFSSTEREANPEVIYITWQAESNVVPAYLNTDPVSYIYKDKNGNTQQTNIELSFSQRRDWILLGQINHPDLTDIAGFDQTLYSPAASAATLYDIAEVIKPVNFSGNLIEPRTATTMRKTLGAVVFPGISLVPDKKSPNERITSLVNDFLTYYFWSDGAGGHNRLGTPLLSPDASKYDDGTGGVSVPNGVVPVGKYTIQPMLWAGGPSPIFDNNNSFLFGYGKRIYNSIDEALSNCPDSSDRPFDAFRYMIRGWLIVRSGYTDLQDPNQAIFVEADRFGVAKAGQNALVHKHLATATLNADTTTKVGAWQKVSWTLPVQNDDGIFDPLQPTRFTAQTDGLYNAAFFAAHLGTAGKQYDVRITKNGGITPIGVGGNSGPANNKIITSICAFAGFILKGDYIEFERQHDNIIDDVFLASGTSVIFQQIG